MAKKEKKPKAKKVKEKHPRQKKIHVWEDTAASILTFLLVLVGISILAVTALIGVRIFQNEFFPVTAEEVTAEPSIKPSFEPVYTAAPPAHPRNTPIPSLPDNTQTLLSSEPDQTESESNAGQAAASGDSGRGDSDHFYTYDNPQQQQTPANYVLNISSRKFHYPSCPSVRQIKPENYLEFYGTRTEVTDKGYVSCGRCKP